MLYAKQVAPEYQEDDLFWTNSKNELRMNNDIYEENVIIDGNREFREFFTPAYRKIKKISSDIWYDWEYLSSCGFANRTEFIEFYLSREDGKRYSKKDISVWIKLLDNWDEDEDLIIRALNLITRKNWRRVTMRGYMQREWQYMYVNEEITDGEVEYIETCYFNTGMEFAIYDDEECVNSYYVKDTDELCEHFEYEIKKGEFEILLFDGWNKTPKYRTL